MADYKYTRRKTLAYRANAFECSKREKKTERFIYIPRMLNTFSLVINLYLRYQLCIALLQVDDVTVKTKKEEKKVLIVSTYIFIR